MNKREEIKAVEKLANEIGYFNLMGLTAAIYRSKFHNRIKMVTTWEHCIKLMHRRKIQQEMKMADEYIKQNIRYKLKKRTTWKD